MKVSGLWKNLRPLEFPAKNSSATDIQFINREHYVAGLLAWHTILDDFFDKQEAQWMACASNFDFFLEHGLITFTVRDEVVDEEEVLAVKLMFWSPLDQQYVPLYDSEVGTDAMSIWFGMIDYYGAVN